MSMRAWAASAVVVLSSAAIAAESPRVVQAIYQYPTGGAIVGQGWSTFHERATPATCVEVDVVPLERSSYSSSVQQAVSSLSVLRAQTSSLSASYKGSGAKASSSVSTSSSRQVNSDAQNFLFIFESSDQSTFAVPPGSVRGGASVLSQELLKNAGGNPNLSPMLQREAAIQPQQTKGNAIKLARWAEEVLKDSATEFTRLCGEGFVSAIHRGAKVHLVITNSNNNEEVKRSIAASLSASGYGASGKASYTKTDTKKTGEAQLSYRSFQEGGVPLRPVALKADSTTGLLNLQDVLPRPSDLLANPTAFRVVVTPYSEIAAGLANRLSTPLNLLTYDDYYVALSDLYEVVSALQDERQALKDRQWKLYGGPDRLRDIKDAIHADLAFLEGVIAQCFSSARNCTVKSAVNAWREENKPAQQAAQNPADANSLTRGLAELVAAQPSWMAKALTLQKQLLAPGDKQQLANAASKSLESKQEEEERAALAEFERDVAKFQNLTANEQIDSEFFLRFYWYLTQIPLTTQMLDLDTELTVPTSPPADLDRRLLAIRDKIEAATFKHRIQPWKEFFCESLKSDALCVDDAALRDLVRSTLIAVAQQDMTLIPPPKVPVQKRKRKCGSSYPGKCL